MSYPVLRSAASFNSFLFGSIKAISDGELYTVAVVSGIIVLAFCSCTKNCFIWRWMNAPPGCLESP